MILYMSCINNCIKCSDCKSGWFLKLSISENNYAIFNFKSKKNFGTDSAYGEQLKNAHSWLFCILCVRFLMPLFFHGYLPSKLLENIIKPKIIQHIFTE